jgi:hypothetical protein
MNKFATILGTTSLLVVNAQLALAEPADGATDTAAPADTSMVAPTEAAPEAPADEAPAAEPAAKAWYDKVTVGGLVDTYYSALLTGPEGTRVVPGVGTPLRVFDGNQGSINMAYTELNVAMAAEPAGFRLDLGVGPAGTAANGGAAAGVDTGIVVQQAYASIKLPGSKTIVLDAGKFVTNAGAEVIEAKDNWLYSRSLLFGWAIPFAHTGARLTATLSDKLTLQASVLNGWDNHIDNNAWKTVGASAFLTPGPKTNVYLNFYGGKEDSDDFRMLIDAVAVQKINDKLTVNLNADFGKQGDASWYGASLMAKYDLSPKMGIAVRGEYFGDPDGARIGVAEVNYMEATVGVSHKCGDNAEFRAEVRADMASEDVFYDAKGMQATAQTALLGWF